MSRVLDAGVLRQAVVAALADLRAARASIDAANVYPVADSDTGTNLVMTMEAVVAALEKSPDDAPGTARAVRSGSLVGARGNSGVILAQILRAFADAVEAGGADVDQVARGFKRATELAYDAVLEPAEGTILTVASAAGDAAQGSHDNVAEQLHAAARAAADALAHTPEQLPALAAAGVVDAGGMGLLIVLEALARAAGADIERPAPTTEDDVPPPVRDEGSSTYRLEVQYLLHTDAANLDPLRKLLGTIGDSVAVIGGEGLWRVHVHTDDRARAISLGEAFGEPSDVEVVDFAEQIRATNERARERRPTADAPATGAPGARGIPLAHSEHGAALIAVVSGPGVARLFRELGAITVDGAVRDAPSDDALRDAIESAPTQDVIVLPNNEDVYTRLLDMKDSLSHRIVVLRSADIAHGLSAAVAYGDARDTDAAVREMAAALSRVRTGMVLLAPAAMDTPLGHADPGHAIGIAEGGLVKVDEDVVGVATAVATALVTEEHELLTILAGEAVSADERERVRAAVKNELPGTTVEIHDGGQPLHRYVMAAE